MPNLWWILVPLGMILVGALFVWRPMRAASRESRLARARRDFHVQRERLEAKFVQLAGAQTAGRTAHWDDCDFDDDVAYVRNRNTGELSAFVGITVPVDASTDPDSGAGGAAGGPRAATAVFRFDGRHWETDGRTILNLSPAEAIRFYRHDLEMVDQEFAPRM